MPSSKEGEKFLWDDDDDDDEVTPETAVGGDDPDIVGAKHKMHAGVAAGGKQGRSISNPRAGSRGRQRQPHDPIGLSRHSDNRARSSSRGDGLRRNNSSGLTRTSSASSFASIGSKNSDIREPTWFAHAFGDCSGKDGAPSVDEAESGAKEKDEFEKLRADDEDEGKEDGEKRAAGDAQATSNNGGDNNAGFVDDPTSNRGNSINTTDSSLSSSPPSVESTTTSGSWETSDVFPAADNGEKWSNVNTEKTMATSSSGGGNKGNATRRRRKDEIVDDSGRSCNTSLFSARDRSIQSELLDGDVSTPLPPIPGIRTSAPSNKQQRHHGGGQQHCSRGG